MADPFDRDSHHSLPQAVPQYVTGPAPFARDGTPRTSMWGGILALEYALTYQQHLRGLIISNMMASIPAYNRYAEEVLMPAMDQAALAEIQRLEAAPC